MKMWVYVVRRVLLLFPVVIGVMTITFAMLSTLPVEKRLTAYYGTPKIPYSPTVSCSYFGGNPNLQCPNPTYHTLVHRLGLDRPIYVQWAIYIYNSFTLNWGTASKGSNAAEYYGIGGLPVTTALAYYLPYTLELAALSLIIILALAIPIGNYAAVLRNRPFDQGARVMSFSGFALPGFLLATFFLIGATAASGGLTAYCNHTSDAFEQWYNSWPAPTCIPGGQPSWFGIHRETYPTGFPTIDAILHQNWYLAFESVKRLILPALAIAYGTIAGVLRFVRNSMLEVMNLDFIRTARSKGVSESTVVRKHAGRNSLNVTITVLGLTFAFFIGGFPIIESVFHLNGVGLLLALSIQGQYDYGLIVGSTLLFTIIVVIANIIVDILYAYLDPRVRLG